MVSAQHEEQTDSTQSVEIEQQAPEARIANVET
jgi:hypothetical protein